jgi:methylenetetrahydrofolate dehydrogenase (NADP+)/methenyltetrahydrofolate cyclohydrolase
LEVPGEAFLVATLLDGKIVSAKILSDLKTQINSKKLKPHLAIVLVGEDPASVTYVNQKKKRGEEIGIKVTIHPFPASIEQTEVEDQIKRLNSDLSVKGIIVQLPLPDRFDKQALLAKIALPKDVDGLSGQSPYLSATAVGIMELLGYYHVPLQGQKAAVFGASDLVGKPVARLLTEAGARVDVIDIDTPKPEKISSQADIIVVAIGQPRFLTAAFVKKGAVVVDVGITKTEEGLVGDVDFGQVEKLASYITPVPGGVGPMTVAALLKNVVRASS